MAGNEACYDIWRGWARWGKKPMGAVIGSLMLSIVLDAPIDMLRFLKKITYSGLLRLKECSGKPNWLHQLTNTQGK